MEFAQYSLSTAASPPMRGREIPVQLAWQSPDLHNAINSTQVKAETDHMSKLCQTKAGSSHGFSVSCVFSVTLPPCPPYLYIHKIHMTIKVG